MSYKDLQNRLDYTFKDDSLIELALLSTTDILALATMKNAAKCDT